MRSKCGNNKKVTHKAQLNVLLMFLPHFDVFCNLTLHRPLATWNPFVSYDKKRDVVNNEVIYAFVLQYIIKENQTKCVGDRATKRKKLSCNPANTEGEMIILKL